LIEVAKNLLAKAHLGHREPIVLQSPLKRPLIGRDRWARAKACCGSQEPFKQPLLTCAGASDCFPPLLREGLRRNESSEGSPVDFRLSPKPP
jgi:hypothetical protein